MSQEEAIRAFNARFEGVSTPEAKAVRTAERDAYEARYETVRARKLLREVADSGVEHDDPRIDYVTVRVDRDVWDRVQAFVA